MLLMHHQVDLRASDLALEQPTKPQKHIPDRLLTSLSATPCRSGHKLRASLAVFDSWFRITSAPRGHKIRISLMEARLGTGCL